MSGKYWEPDPLEVGTRVRVRRGGECPTRSVPNLIDGRLATVVAVTCPSGAPGHTYTIAIDGFGLACGARVELERLP